VPHSIPLTFLGTGNAFAPGRYWNSFLIDGRVLVEPSPSVLPNLRRVGADLAAIDAVFISHFHADHTFGWPFLLLEYMARTRRTSPLWVIGPPGVEGRLDEMLRVGAYPSHARAAAVGVDLRFVDIDEGEQEAGPVRFRATRVEHEPSLDCYGFVIRHDGRAIGYSGDTRLCDGLRKIAAGSDVLALECAERHDGHNVHMTLEGVRTLRAECPHLPFILTHVDDDVDADGLPAVRVAEDLETIHV
jgi:ribonuclease Z